jgi:hypothetical protein
MPRSSPRGWPRRSAAGSAGPGPTCGRLQTAVREHVFAGNKEATALGELIVTEGGPPGVALVATARGASLAYFGGSARLRSGLASSNCVGRDSETLEMINSTVE